MAKKINKKNNEVQAKSIIQPESTLTMSENKSNSSWQILVLLFVTFLAYVPSLKNGFVNWDDDPNLLENKNLNVFNWESIVNIFTSDVIGNYNPLPIFTFALEKWIFGLPMQLGQEHAVYFHVTNLLLHLVSVYFVYLIGKSLSKSSSVAILLAALFAIHPMRVESVAWVTERKDVLFASFYFAAIYNYIKWLDTKKSFYYILVLVLFFFSLLSKIQAVSLPLSLVAVDLLYGRKLELKLFIEKIPHFIFSLIFGLVGVYILIENKSIDVESQKINFTALDRFFIGTYTFAVYLYKVIIPFPLSALYAYPKYLSVLHYLSPTVFFGYIYLMYYSFKNDKRNLLFGLLFFFVNIVFMLQFVGAGQGYLADRFTYVAYFGLFYVMAYFAYANLSFSNLIKYVTIGLLFIFLIITYKQQPIWNDGISLWTHAMKYNQNNHLPYNNRAMWYRDHKQFKEALVDYKYALALNDEGTTYNSIGKCYFDMGNAKESLPYYDQAISKPEPKGEFYINRGAANAMLGNSDQALKDLNKGLELDPKHKNGYFNRSLLYFNMGDYDSSLKDYDSYLGIDPYNADIIYEKGLCLNALKRSNEALTAFNSAIELKNDVPLYYQERARAYILLGDKEKAKLDVQKAQSLGLQVQQNVLDMLK